MFEEDKVTGGNEQGGEWWAMSLEWVGGWELSKTWMQFTQIAHASPLENKMSQHHCCFRLIEAKVQLGDYNNTPGEKVSWLRSGPRQQYTLPVF